jgi:flavin reductase (DIM6/NTAB) family NADH-FMN oxidoreductase RutF
MSFSHSDFRHCLGRFATGVTIVTTIADKNPVGVTINSFASLSLSPPLVLFSLDKGSSVYESFINSDNFVVNILAREQEDLSRLYSAPAAIDWTTIKYTKDTNNCPIFDGNIAYLECSKELIQNGGDHSIFILKVNKLKQVSDAKPLLYYKGEYNGIA